MSGAHDSKAKSESASRPAATVSVAVVALSGDAHYNWRVVSDCGVVKVYSSRDGCMVAVNPLAARRLAAEFVEAMNDAADLTEIRSYGQVVSSKAGPS